MADGQQTHDDIPEIPAGIELPDSSGSLTPDAGDDFEVDDYADVGIPDSYPADKAEGGAL